MAGSETLKSKAIAMQKDTVLKCDVDKSMHFK